MGKVTDCPVKDLISFAALENPPWHTTTNASQRKTVAEMITGITEYRKRWEQATKENIYSQELIKKVKEQFLVNFIFHVNLEEGHGISTLPETENFLRNCSSQKNLDCSFSIEEQETMNLKNAYQNLADKVKREERPCDYGLLEVSLLQETHRLILHDIPLPRGFTPPGKMSNKPRVTEFRGEIYHYANPEDMESAVSNLLDKYNFLFDHCTRDELKNSNDIYDLFKTCAWMLMELLDLHPFSDGNGRLCRILCSYSLSKLNPFPTPIYNVWTDSSKGDYIQALVEARMSPGRHPCALTTMIIECSYYGWEKIFRTLDEETAVNSSTKNNKTASGPDNYLPVPTLKGLHSLDSYKKPLAIVTLPCLANIKMFCCGKFKASNSVFLKPEIFLNVCSGCYYFLCFIFIYLLKFIVFDVVQTFDQTA